MRIVFGVLSLLVVVAIVGVLSKKQLSASAPAVGAAPGATPQQQIQQFKGAAEAAMQQARPMPDESN